MERITVLLRLALLLLLLWLAISPPASMSGDDVVEIGAAGDAARLHPLPAARAYLRRSVSAPEPAELEALAALAERAPLFALPPNRPHLHADPPADPVAGRAAAIGFHLLGSAGEPRLVRLLDAAGLLDSATVRLDGNGEAAGAFTVRPATAGWHVWTLATDSAVDVRTAAWVGQASPLRVLIAPGLASWEGREVARALERGGAHVTLLQPLGRDLAIAGAPASLPADPDALREWDAIIVLAGASLDDARRAALDAWVAAGGGVLIAGTAAGAAVVDSIDARRIEWVEWPGIRPLPPIEATVAGARVNGSIATSRVIAADAEGTPRLVLRTPGRGRAAELGFTETWRWGLEAGRTDELAAFWLGLAEWLAGGVRADIDLSADPGAAPTGTPIHVTAVTFTADSLPLFLHLRRPDGLEERIPLERAGDGTARGAFVALRPGVHSLELPSRTPAVSGLAAVPAPAAVHMATEHPGDGGTMDTASATGTGTPTRAWPRLALLAHRSGGAMIAADSVDGRARALAGQGPPARLPLLILAAALGLAFAEWLLRRLGGQA